MKRIKIMVIPTFILILLTTLILAQKKNPMAGLDKNRKVQLTYKVIIAVPPLSSENVKIWLPLPATNTYQSTKILNILPNKDYKIISEPEYNNRFIYFEVLRSKLQQEKDYTISVSFEILRRAYSVFMGSNPKEIIPEKLLKRYLSSDNLVSTSGKIAIEAKAVAGRGVTPLQKAQLLYDHLLRTLKYDKTGNKWGRGDAIYMCNIRKGNCTDFHSLFIGEARSLGIPARFIMGIPLPETTASNKIQGYHCWAEIFDEKYGWLPVDISEASKFPKKKEKFFGGLDANRIQLTIGRDIKLPKSNTVLNYSIYPYVEVDGKAYLDITTEFTFLDYKGV